MKEFRKLEDDMFEEKKTNFRTHKSKKQWVTSCQTLLSRLVGHSMQMIVSSKKVRNLAVATLLVLGIGGATVASSHFVLAAPPDSGTVNWTPMNDIATLSNGEVVTYLSLNSGDPVYCLAMGVPLTDPSTAAQQDAMNAIWAKLSENQKGVINNIAYLANQASAATNRTIYTAARLAVWHQLFVYGIASGDATPSMIASFGPDSAGVTVAGVQTEFDSLISQAQALTDKPSFDGQTVKVVVGVDKTLTDSNSVLSNFKYPLTSIAGLNVSSSGNSIVLDANSNTKLGPGIISYSTGFALDRGTFVYSTNGDSSGTVSQPVIAAQDPYRNDFSLNVNVVLDGSLKIVKKQTGQDSHQGSGNIAGAKFDVTMYLSDGKTVDTGIDGTFDTVDSNGTKTGTVTFTKGVARDVTTGEDGTVTIKDFSPVGDIAKSKETSVPAPYTLGHTDATGNLVNDPVENTITEDSTKGTAQLTFTDNKQVGAIKFKKSGVYNGSDLLNSGYQFKGTVIGVKDKDGNVVAQATLDEKGEGSTTDNPLSSPLVIGEIYTAFEIKAGDGFANTFAPKEVKFTYQGSDQVIDWENVSGTNTEITGDVEFKKTMQDDVEGKTSEIEGANLSIYYASDVKDSSGKVLHKAGDLVNLKDGFKGLPIEITKGTQDEAAMPDVDNDLTIRIGDDNEWGIKNLTVADYKAVETQAGYGTSVNTTEYKFSITKQDDKTQVIKVNQDLPNQALRWNMMFTKVLEENSSLTGLNDAKFQMIGLDDNTKAAFTNYGFAGKGDTATSGTATADNGFTTDGLTAFYNIPLGTTPDKDGYIARYQIKEIETPKGTKTIVPINVDVKVNLNSDGAPQSYTYKFYWSDTKQVIHEETYSTATLRDDKVLTIRPNLGLIADEVITPPAIATTAVDEADNDKTLSVGMAVVHDTATVSNLSPNTDYTMTGQVVKTSDGTPKLGKDGKAITSKVSFKSDERGNAIVALNTPAFDTAAEQGEQYTVLETVKDGTGKTVVEDTNWKNNPSETVKVTTPTGKTQVGVDEAPLSAEVVTVTDHYKGSGYVPGTKVKVTISEAYSKELKKTVPVLGTATFTADDEGKVSGDIPVQVNVKELQGTTITFYEKASVGDVVTVDNHNPDTPDETIKVPTPKPSIDDEKTDGKLGTPGKGNDTDKDNNIGSNDRDDAKSALEVQPGQTTKIFDLNTNNGTEAETNIIWTDTTLSGPAVTNWTHTFKSKDGKTTFPITIDAKTGAFLDDKGKVLIWQPGDHIISEGTLPAMTPGQTHSNQTSITATGVVSGQKVHDKDNWYGKTPKPQPHKFDLKGENTGKDITSNALLNDDKEIATKPDFALTGEASKPTTQETDDTYKQEVANTAKEPTVDKTSNNSANNNNTLNVTHGQTYAFEIWWDDSQFTKDAQLQQDGIVEYLDNDALTTDTSKWVVTGASDGKVVSKDLYTITKGAKITDKKDAQYGKTPYTVQWKATKTVKNVAGKDVKIIDTSKVTMGQYYKIDFSVKVNDDVKPDYEIKNTAKQIGIDLDGNGFNQNTETRQNQVVQPAIKTKAHTDNGDQLIDSSENKAYDEVELTDVVAGEQGMAYLHRVVRDNNDKVVSDDIVSTISFKVDDAVAKSKETEVETNLDKSKDSNLPAGQTVSYVWGENLYNKGDNTKTAQPIAKYYDQNDKAETLNYAPKPVTPTPNTPPMVNIFIPDTGTTLGKFQLAGYILLVATGLAGLYAYLKKRLAKSNEDETL
ncbi:VaFE repeat-containing surface-anchored protein [Lactococcus lactis]|uniref:VaFE repeat-containing surface-anchored protein n=1 Tax=Lactococcus lactis TaxID=1358 RepID=UPI0018C5ACE1|nr:VaFE repeat-containing surface-anchored protein [Lactococcus lactis]